MTEDRIAEQLREIRAEQERQWFLLTQILAAQDRHTEAVGHVRQLTEKMKKNTVSIAVAPRSGL